MLLVLVTDEYRAIRRPMAARITRLQTPTASCVDLSCLVGGIFAHLSPPLYPPTLTIANHYERIASIKNGAFNFRPFPNTCRHSEIMQFRLNVSAGVDLLSMMPITMPYRFAVASLALKGQLGMRDPQTNMPQKVRIPQTDRRDDRRAIADRFPARSDHSPEPVEIGTRGARSWTQVPGYTCWLNFCIRVLWVHP